MSHEMVTPLISSVPEHLMPGGISRTVGEPALGTYGHGKPELWQGAPGESLDPLSCDISFLQEAYDEQKAAELPTSTLVENYYSQDTEQALFPLAQLPELSLNPVAAIQAEAGTRPTITYRDSQVQHAQAATRETPSTITLERIRYGLKMLDSPPSPTDSDAIPYEGPIPEQVDYTEVDAAEDALRQAAQKVFDQKEAPDRAMLRRVSEGLDRLPDDPTFDGRVIVPVPVPTPPSAPVQAAAPVFPPTVHGRLATPRDLYVVTSLQEAGLDSLIPQKAPEQVAEPAPTTNVVSQPLPAEVTPPSAVEWTVDAETMPLRTVEIREDAAKLNPRVVGRTVLKALGLKMQIMRDALGKPIRSLEPDGTQHIVRELVDSDTGELVDTLTLPKLSHVAKVTHVEQAHTAAEEYDNSAASLIGKLATKFGIGRRKTKKGHTTVILGR